MNSHVFARFDREKKECTVSMYVVGQAPVALAPVDLVGPPFSLVAEVACPPDVEDLLQMTDLQLPMHVPRSDVYRALRAAMVCGWNEGARSYDLVMTIDEFSAALETAPWKIHQVLKKVLDKEFPWVLSLTDDPLVNEAVDWKGVQTLLAACFQFGFIYGDAGVL